MNNDLPSKPLIAMVHLPNLKPYSSHSLSEIIEYTLSEVKKIEKAGFDGIMVENFQDSPFANDCVEEEVIAKLAIILHEVKKQSSIQIGVNILRNACLQAMKLASTLNLSFIRCNVWEGAYVTDQGIIQGAAYKVINYKNQSNSKVKVFADIFVKHASPLGKFSLEDAAKNVIERGQADYIVVSGVATGATPDINNILRLNAIGIRPMIGSGLTQDNLDELFPIISGAIVGTSIKMNSNVLEPIDLNKAKILVKKWKLKLLDK